MKSVVHDLTAAFAPLQGAVSIVSTRHLPELQKDISAWKKNGKMSEEFYRNSLSFFRFEKPTELPQASSIIVLALPQKTSIVTFQLDGRSHRVIIPPTYLYTQLREHCSTILSEVLNAPKKEIVSTRLPMKLLTVRSGLGRYGRNNICYVNEKGSFQRLEGFYTNLDFGIDSWMEKTVMDRCNTCSLCMQACPTKCIRNDDFLIHAEQCLTNVNENPGSFPFWVDPSFHHALVGCLQCQTICPENKHHIPAKEMIETFSEEETTLILHDTPQKDLPKDLILKLQRLDMEDYYSLLSRNLSVLINK